jgi:hypothetical protein
MVPSANTITGVLTEYTTHEPIAGATIYAGLWDSSTRYSTSSDASGTFTFTGIPAGDYSVWSERAGYQSTGSSWAHVTDLVGADVSITAYQPVVRGNVTYNGAPVSSALVTLYSRVDSSSPWVGSRTESTDSNGAYYFFDTAAAEYAIGFGGGWTNSGYMKPCFYLGASTVDSATPLTFDLTHTMDGVDLALAMADASITGKVTKADGTAVPNAEVLTYEEDAGGWRPTREGVYTDARGNFAVYGLDDGVYRLGVPGYTDRSTMWGPAFHTAASPSASTIASAADFTVEASRTATGINVVLPSNHETLVRDAFESDDATADAKPVSAMGTTDEHTLLPAGDDDWISFEVTAGHTYTIETTGSAKYPLWSSDTDTYLYLYGSDRKTKLAYNDDRDGYSGDYLSLITWTAPSTKTVYAKVTDYGSAVGSDSSRGAYGFRVTDLDAPALTGSVSGRVVDRDTAQGVPGALIDLGNYVYHVTDADGYFSIEGIAPRSYSVRVFANGYSQTNVSVIVPEGGVSVDVTLTPFAQTPTTLKGNAGSANGSVNGATVTAVAGGSAGATSTVVGSGGNYSFTGIEPGVYTVTFSKAGYVSAIYSGVSVDASQTTNRSGYLVQLGTLHGSVIASGAAALSGASVSVDGVEATKTASDGTYSLSDLALGLHTLKFSAVGFVPYSQEFAIDDADSLTIDRALTTQPVVPTKPVITRTPAKSSLVYRRKHGRASFSLSATVRDTRGARLGGVLLLLERSYDGKHWSKTYRIMTNASGVATKKLYADKKQKMYYRWVVRPTSTHLSVSTKSQKVTIK